MTPARCLAAAATGCALLSGCVSPATTTSAYQGKAALTAQAAVSQIRTAVLATHTAADGRLPAASLQTILVDAGSSFGSVQATFDSVQPPDTPTADGLRSTLDRLLNQAAGAMAELRIEARRHDEGAMLTTAARLRPVADKLSTFGRTHQS